MSHYLFDNAAQQAGQRFASLETIYDPWTMRHLEATGISAGWRCWEVGAGGGSIASWLAERCGPTGHVLVTDIDPRYLTAVESLACSTVAVQRHDIGTDPPPALSFDLVHARLVLIHVPAREQALEQMVAALAPGGWLVIEDFDITLIDRTYPTANRDDAALTDKMLAAQDRLMAGRSGEQALTWGRSLYQRLRAHGLANVGMDGYMALREGKSAGANLMRANFEQIRTEATTAGLFTDDEFTRMIALLDDPNFATSAPVLFTVWGRRS